MSVQLLDKTRKINKLLHNNHSTKVVFNDICEVLMETLSSNILVISKKGKVLGISLCPGVEEITELIEDKVGGYVDAALNERLLGVLSTKENVNLQTLGFERPGVERYTAIICPIMDARRNQVYTGIYEFCDGKLQILENQMAVSVTEIAEKLNALGREVIFLGDGVPVYRKTLAEVMKIPYSFAPAHMNRQRASAVAVLGAQYYVQGRAESAMEHKPDYLRLSQAERERKEREEQNRA